MSTKIFNNRKKIGLSQEDVAQSLGVSRPTYCKIEDGLIELSGQQKIILNSLFKTSEDYSVPSSPVPINDAVWERETPKENTRKFETVFLYILNKIGNKPNIGQTAIYKLLYFIDFDYFEKFEEQLIGAVYIKNTYGPTPVSFPKIVANLKKQGKLVEVHSKYFGKDRVRYLATCEPGLEILSGREIAHIDKEIERLSFMSAAQLSDLSHKDVPWIVAGNREILEYEHVFYRSQDTATREYEEL